MIHFNFTVTDEEAETIMDCINDEIHFCFDKSNSQLDESTRKWFLKRRDYLIALKAKMLKNYLTARETR